MAWTIVENQSKNHIKWPQGSHFHIEKAVKVTYLKTQARNRADRRQQYCNFLKYIRYEISIFWNPVWKSLEHLILSLELIGLKLNEPYWPIRSISKSQVSNSEVANFVVSQITPWISVVLLSYKWILIKLSRVLSDKPRPISEK